MCPSIALYLALILGIQLNQLESHLEEVVRVVNWDVRHTDMNFYYEWGFRIHLAPRHL